MEIAVQIKTIYGVDKIYPVDDHGKLFAQLAGTTTLTEQAINTIKELGYKVVVKQEVKEL